MARLNRIQQYRSSKDYYTSWMVTSQHGSVVSVRIVDQVCVGGRRVRVDPVRAVIPEAVVLILDGDSDGGVRRDGRRRIREVVGKKRSGRSGSGGIRVSGLSVARCSGRGWRVGLGPLLDDVLLPIGVAVAQPGRKT